MSKYPVARLSALLMLTGVGVAFAISARAADTSGCKNPAWASTSMPGFTIDSCEHKSWASHQVYVASGSKTLQGHFTSVEYAWPSETGPSAEAVKQYQIKAAEGAGAKLMSDPSDDFNAVFTRKTTQGEFWYIYNHGSGNDASTTSYTLTTVEIAPPVQAVIAQAMTAPLDTKTGACKNPPWLVKQFAYFKVDSCESRDWDVRKLDLPAGAKTLEGKRTVVTYQLTDEKKDPVALLVQINYINALLKIGAKLVSDPTDDFKAVLNQKTTQGEFWYIYEHGGGSDDSTTSYTLTTFEIAPPAQYVVAREMAAPLNTQTKNCANPPWLVKQFPWFKLDGCTNRDFDSVTLDLPGGEKTLAGRVHEANYTLTDDSKDMVALAVRDNYINALRKIGAKLISDPDDDFQAVLTQKTAQGELWYIYRHGSGSDDSTTSYMLTTVQAGGPPPKACKIEVYGVNFDFDKATLRPDSTPVLEQVLAMLKAAPTLQFEIGGHTDNVGTAAHNLTLSDQRAKAVVDWLVTHGIAGSRLTAHGYGETRPLVPNTSDKNRAKNRRVELTKRNCTTGKL